ncbi:MAG: PilT protein domain protein [Candidatus Beckwithbacteria bacterium GW2011_GWA2_43_10]|uniref:PilT protein domain protein n=1 Tax=Candidatus Beckwithbacteria bacterium GW2011_GWA2_43_10 TaxID=1618369 RepID=A0A0G1EBF8_9BACT|nr:MAG: PilT protein domain protein [Candidatus Beckwithbacteria bacterium GW2011_GWA2_43_10]
MAENTKVVVDASVVLNWLLPDEKKAEKTNRIFDELHQKKIHLIAPALLFYEIINALKSTGLRKRMNPGEIIEAMAVFLDLKIKLITQEDRGMEIIKTALKFNLTGYDAAYVQLAKDLRAKLLTLDKRLLLK